MATKNTTIAIPIEISERIEQYCRYHGILKKDFVALCIDYLERTEVDLRENELDSKVGRLLSPISRALGDLKEVKETMESANRDNEVIRNLFSLIQTNMSEQRALPGPDIIIQETQGRIKAEIANDFLTTELERVKAIAAIYQKELKRISEAGLFDRKPYIKFEDKI